MVTKKKIHTPDQYGKVAVLYGGDSSEREISIETGNAVHTASLSKGVSAHLIDTRQYSVFELPAQDFDRAFIALHGKGGEDGQIQGALETLSIPYTGSGVLGSALAMDKTRSKWIWQQNGLPTPQFMEICNEEDLQTAKANIPFPVMIKPVTEGSSNGAAKVTDPSMLEDAWQQARQFDDRIMCEQWITGAEYTVGILQDEILPAIKLETRREFYNYEAKYLDDDTSYICPCGLGNTQLDELNTLAWQAYSLVNASGWGRVDVVTDTNGNHYLIEVNTIPGMTSHSLVPMAARQAGIEFDDLVLRILDTSFQSREKAGQNREAVI